MSKNKKRTEESIECQLDREADKYDWCGPDAKLVYDARKKSLRNEKAKEIRINRTKNKGQS